MSKKEYQQKQLVALNKIGDNISSLDQELHRFNIIIGELVCLSITDDGERLLFRRKLEEEGL